ncbi:MULTISPECIES: hypothetical protein [Prauserella salsuginis group]|uniref:Uncharacterized protein n=2 Tax=Prauserella salsuginis group TaxID=2893672 RepID=A0A839XDY9_9PSEU|nr:MULTISPECIES: hypothetical protein [Prauserella salsuginis group]MBB3661500.1 hypothetical protein [Prauserella sediminis]
MSTGAVSTGGVSDVLAWRRGTVGRARLLPGPSGGPLCRIDDRQEGKQRTEHANNRHWSTLRPNHPDGPALISTGTSFENERCGRRSDVRFDNPEHDSPEHDNPEHIATTGVPVDGPRRIPPAEHTAAG